jgi:hypothetical protein
MILCSARSLSGARVARSLSDMVLCGACSCQDECVCCEDVDHVKMHVEGFKVGTKHDVAIALRVAFNSHTFVACPRVDMEARVRNVDMAITASPLHEYMYTVYKC